MASLLNSDGFALDVATALDDLGADLYTVGPEPDRRLPNVHLGTSVEDQPWADVRVPQLRRTPAAVRFLSMEPLLAPVSRLDLTGIGWVVCGGESGTGARPMHPDWARSIRDGCVAAGVPFFFKQWGGWAPVEAGQQSLPSDIKWVFDDGTTAPVGQLLTSDQRTAGPVLMRKVGKHAAGRVLDGRTWDEFPAEVVA